MVKASELRLGNFILYEPIKGLGFEIIKVKSLPFEKISDQKPIPLTEERLLKFGFKKYLFNLLKLNNMIYDLKDGTLQYDFDDNNFMIKEIKYVHILQNLVFTLEGKELEII